MHFLRTTQFEDGLFTHSKHQAIHLPQPLTFQFLVDPLNMCFRHSIVHPCHCLSSARSLCSACPSQGRSRTQLCSEAEATDPRTAASSAPTLYSSQPCVYRDCYCQGRPWSCCKCGIEIEEGGRCTNDTCSGRGTRGRHRCCKDCTQDPELRMLLFRYFHLSGAERQ